MNTRWSGSDMWSQKHIVYMMQTVLVLRTSLSLCPDRSHVVVNHVTMQTPWLAPQVFMLNLYNDNALLYIYGCRLSLFSKARGKKVLFFYSRSSLCESRNWFSPSSLNRKPNYSFSLSLRPQMFTHKEKSTKLQPLKPYVTLLQG